MKVLAYIKERRRTREVAGSGIAITQAAMQEMPPAVQQATRHAMSSLITVAVLVVSVGLGPSKALGSENMEVRVHADAGWTSTSLLGEPGATYSVAAVSRAPAVRLERGQPLEVAVAVPLSGPLAGFGTSFANAARMAVELHPNVRGFPVQLDVFDADCFSTDAAVASAIVANDAIAGVIGHACSAAFAPVLPFYEAAGVVTISGSATDPFLPPLGPTVFNRVIVSDDEGGAAWVMQVEALPRVLSWQQDYALEFGEPPTSLAQFYYDATLLLLRRLHEVGTLDRGALVIDRAALAAAVRGTVDFRGVSCSITLEANGNRVNDPAALDRCAKQTG